MAPPTLTRQNAFRGLPIDSPRPYSVAEVLAAEAHAQAYHSGGGGDFEALFRSSMIVFKPHDAASAISAARKLKDEVVKHLPKFNINFNFFSFDFNLSLPAVLRHLREFFEMIREGLRQFYEAIITPARQAIQMIKDAFMALLRGWKTLMDALYEAFKSLFDFLPDFGIGDIFSFFSFLFDFIPDLVINFIGGLLEAITPVLGQVVACGKMLKTWADVTKAAFKKYKLKDAVARLDVSNRFNEAAKNAFMVQVNRSLARTAEGAALATGNAALSVSGWVTFGVSSTIGGIAMAVAKLAVHIGYAVKDFREAFAANAELWKLRSLIHREVNPAEIYNASPTLAAYYVQAASSSTLYAVDTSVSSWREKAEENSRKSIVLKQTAAKLISGSRLCLVQMNTIPTPAEIFGATQARAKAIGVGSALSLAGTANTYASAAGV